MIIPNSDLISNELFCLISNIVEVPLQTDKNNIRYYLLLNSSVFQQLLLWRGNRSNKTTVTVSRIPKKYLIIVATIYRLAVSSVGVYLNKLFR